MRFDSYRTIVWGLLLSLTLTSVNAEATCNNPTPDVTPVSSDDLAACLQDLQQNIAQKLIVISNYVPAANPSSMKTDIEDLLSWEQIILNILSDASADNLITSEQSAALKKKYINVFNFLEKADDSLQNGQPSSVVLQRLRSANNAHNQVGKAIAKLFANSMVPALVSNGPDFYKANRNLCLTVSNCPILTTNDIFIDNPYSNLGIYPIKSDSAVLFEEKGGKKKVCLVSGPSMGGGSLTVNACGTILRRLIFNYGDSGADATGNGLPISIKNYTGTCTGNYSGSYTVHFEDGSSDTGPINGSISSTITNGLVSITAPAAGTGKLSNNGKTRIKTAAFGSLNIPGITVQWNGSVWIAAKNYETGGVTATASGGWSSKFKVAGISGSASGGWGVSCQ